VISRYTSVILQTKKMSIRLSPSNVSLEGYKIRSFLAMYSRIVKVTSYRNTGTVSDEDLEQVKAFYQTSYDVVKDARLRALTIEMELSADRKHTPRVFVRRAWPDLKTCLSDPTQPSKKCINRKVRFVEPDNNKRNLKPVCYDIPKGHYQELDQWVRHQRNGTEQTHSQRRIEKALLHMYFLKSESLIKR
jgi:hypothetical protein